jgi:hypothetical protein
MDTLPLSNHTEERERRINVYLGRIIIAAVASQIGATIATRVMRELGMHTTLSYF